MRRIANVFWNLKATGRSLMFVGVVVAGVVGVVVVVRYRYREYMLCPM